MNDTPIHELIACPKCDALHRARHLAPQKRAACARCGALLIAPRARSFLHVIALSFTAMILMVGAVFFPFLKISTQGMSHASSVFEVAMAFSEGWLAPLSFAVMALIVGLPVLRFSALIYTLWPLANGRPAWPHARRIFRLADQLEPWSMAEIFVIGTGVALVKLAGLATVSLGPAFWAFGALIIVTALKNAFLSQWTIWDAIGQS
ncbi:MAG: paraquat-inducible protein A [Paracoccaceae bacterium]